MKLLLISLVSFIGLAYSVKINHFAKKFLSRRYLAETNSSTTEQIQELQNDSTKKTYTTGFLRQDTFDWLRTSWIQAQVLPIGVCFREGFNNGSAKLSEVIFVGKYVLRITTTYATSDCTGEYVNYPYIQVIMESKNQLEHFVSHIENIEEALAIYPAEANGIIISSFYSSDGCTGNIAQYDLVSEQCSVYGYPIEAFGTFQCLAEAETMVMTMYGPFDEAYYTFPICPAYDTAYDTAYDSAYDTNPAYDSAYDNEPAYDPAYDMFYDYAYDTAYYGYYEYGVQVTKQPFTCFDETYLDNDDSEMTPYFQTIRCTTGSSSDSSSSTIQSSRDNGNTLSEQQSERVKSIYESLRKERWSN